MNKKVFISYSWGSKEHQEWVVNLGKRLMDDTVDVILDKWSLKEGNDIFHFMESMVNADDIYRVLVICDKNYKNKSDSRDGGVGTETQIITPKIYSNQKQEKFVPIIVERDSENSPYLPVYLSSTKYIDFSDEEYFEDSYEELLRNILEAPSIPKPKLGTKVPLYITESVINNTATNSIVRTLENQLKKNPEKLNSYVSDFLEVFLESLWDFEFKSTSYDINGFGEELIDNLKSYKVLREDFINFIFVVTKSEYVIDVDNLISFFEKKTLYSKPRNQEFGSWSPSNYENFQIIFQELFLYTISFSLKNKNYHLVEEMFYSKYYFYDFYSAKSEPKRYTELYSYHDNLEQYIQSKYNKITGFGHFLITNLSDKLKKNDVIFADLLCHYIGDLFSGENYRDAWFPTTYLYKEGYSNFDFFERLSSERHFEKIKSIFDVDSKEELIKLLSEYKESKVGKDRVRCGRRGHDSIPFLFEKISIEHIGENR